MINRILSLSIRTHLIILVCLLVFPSILLVIYSGLLEREQAIIDAQANCRRFVNTLAARQQTMVVGAEQLTMALSLLPAVQSRNADEVNSILSALPRKDIQYSIITVADKTGLIWASSLPSQGKAFLTDRKYFQDVMRTGMFTSGGYVIGRITKKPILVFGSPVRNKKNVLSGVMSIGLILDYAQDEFEKAKLPAGTFFSMLDHNGVIIYNNSQNKSHKMLQGLRDIKEETFTAMRQGPDEGTFNAIGNDDNVRIFAYKKLRLAHDQEQYLYIRTSIAQASVTAAATAKMQKYLSILGLIFVFGLSVSWLIGKRAIIDRIKILESAAKKLSEGTAYVNVSNLVQGAELGRLANAFDNMSLTLSEREKSLRETEERFRILSEAAFEAIAIHEGGVLISANDQYFKMFGYDPDEAIGKQMMSMTIAPEAIDFATKQIATDSLEPYESIGVRKDGTRFPMEVRGRKMDYKGRIVRFGAIVDITERKQSEEALRSSENKYRTLTEQMPDLIWHKDINNVYVSCNRSYAEAVGLTVDTIAGHRDEDFYPPELVAKYLADDQYIIATGQPLKMEEMWRETRGNRWLHTSKAPLLDKSGNCIGTIGIAHDITERKQVEAERKHMELQLFQSQKMEAIGTLAGGIAHDFNNILSVIIGYAELARDKNQKENKEKYLQETLNGAQRAKNLVKQILTFSRQEDHTEKKPLDIKVLLKEAIKFLRSSIPTTVEINHHITEEDCNIMADPTQMHQVIMNLCTNAAHAMKAGGTLKVELANIELAKDEIPNYPDLQPGHYVKLTVSDTGYGIDPDNIQKIFDPFFTTKSVDEGTGLGLSVVYGIVKGHGGVINVYSEPGKGASFHIYLPRIIQTETKEMDTGKPVIGGTERILFVDDEPALVDIGMRMLFPLGYHVTGATSSKEALDIFCADPQRFDLVITDMTLPKITGIDLSREMLKIRPDIPIILCSGIKEPKTEAQVKSLGIRVYLTKPLTRKELAWVVRDTLDSQKKQAV